MEFRPLLSERARTPNATDVSVHIILYFATIWSATTPLPGLVSSSSSRSCCNTVIILVVRCVHTAAFENGSSSLYRGAGDPQAIRVWRIDGRSHSWEPATGWVFVGQSFCQFHWSWLARLADFFMQAGFFCSGGTLSSCFFGTG